MNSIEMEVARQMQAKADAIREDERRKQAWRARQLEIADWLDKNLRDSWRKKWLKAEATHVINRHETVVHTPAGLLKDGERFTATEGGQPYLHPETGQPAVFVASVRD